MKINLDGIKNVFKTTKGKIVALATAGAIVTGGVAGLNNMIHHSNDGESYSSSDIKLKTLPEEPSDELVDVNIETYGVYLNNEIPKLDNESFALVNMHIAYDDRGNVIEKNNFVELTEEALNNDLQIGYIFNPTSTDKASMYLAVNEIKDLLINYDVNYPIVYNVDSLYEASDDQDKEYNYSILVSFIEKMTENNCYIMIAGKEEALQDMANRFETHKNNIDFKSIDKLVFDDIELKDDYCMKMVDGKITSEYNYTSFIELNGINNKDHFVNDYVHTIKPGDSLDALADIYGINKYNIIKINNKYPNLYDDYTLYNGQQLDIPSEITKNNEILSIRNYEYSKQEKASDLISIKGTYIKDKQIDFNLDKKSFALVEFMATYNEDGYREYISGNYTLQKCVDAKVPFGIVFTPSGCKLSDIYCEIKALNVYTKKYDIKYPIYFNVDTIFESSEEEDYKYNYTLSKAFVEKMEYNGFFVGLIGSQENIERLKHLYNDNGDLDTFNNVSIALNTDTNEQITYEGNVGLIVSKDGSAKSKIDYESIIVNSGLNKENNIKLDYKYTVQSTDTLDSIASKFNFKPWNIRMYNPQYDLSKNVSEGQILYFPNILDESDIEKVEYETIQPEIKLDSEGKYYIGIDVGKDQGEINWEKLAPNIDYAILRFGNGCFFEGFDPTYTTEDNAIDPSFKYNYSECKRLNIPIGVYVFSNYYMDNLLNNVNDDYEEEARLEAEWAAKYLSKNGYQFELPFYMDYEIDTGTLYDNVTPERMARIIEIQKEVIEKYGYYYGLYTNASFFNEKMGAVTIECDKWIANYKYGTLDINGIKNAAPTWSLQGTEYNNSQISSKGILSGIDTEVDINLADEDLFNNSNNFYKRH